MGDVNEAIVAYQWRASSASRTIPRRCAAWPRPYLKTGRPELAGAPLEVAFQDTPNDPKLLQLIGVADDFVGQHREAQARYRRGLELKPGDPALALNLALSLALTENYAEAIAGAAAGRDGADRRATGTADAGADLRPQG